MLIFFISIPKLHPAVKMSLPGLYRFSDTTLNDCQTNWLFDWWNSSWIFSQVFGFTLRFGMLVNYDQCFIFFVNHFVYFLKRSTYRDYLNNENKPLQRCKWILQGNNFLSLSCDVRCPVFIYNIKLLTIISSSAFPVWHHLYHREKLCSRLDSSVCTSDSASH